MALATAELEIRTLESHGEDSRLFPALARLIADAYPIMGRNTTAALAEHTAELPEIVGRAGTRCVIAQRNGVLVGAMRLYDFQMNVRGTDTLTGGVGSVAISLAHKRQGIARALLAWYLNHYRARNAPFAILHPFRPDFYRAIGFGYGTPAHRFRFAPATLRDGGARGAIRFLDANDTAALIACDERVRARTHGLIAKHRVAAERLLADVALRYVGVEEGGELRAFMQTSAAVGGERMRNADELIVRDLTYEDEASLAALLGYLRSQRDQFARVVVESQDDAFYLAADDPRDGSDLAVAPPATHRVAETGLGVMYRILDVPAALATLPASGARFTLRIAVADAFSAETAGTWTFCFDPQARPRHDDGARPDATLTIGIADLSSVVLGSLQLRDVVAHRLAKVEPADTLALVDAAFRAEQPPVCTTRF
jgi:predicted acetyltransferase